MNLNVSTSGLRRVLTSQTQVAFNDNAAKLALVGLAQMVLPPAQAQLLTGLLAGLLVLPFILVSPLCGWLADRFPKKRVLHWSLLLQIFVMALMLVAVFLQSLWLMVPAFFCLALQSALFSPAKQGILKEMVGSDRLGHAVGWMEMLTVVAILVGSFAGGWLFDSATRLTENPWLGASITLGFLTLLALISWAILHRVPEGIAHEIEPFHPNLLWGHFKDLRLLFETRHLRLSALGIAWFFGLGGGLFLILVQAGRETVSTGPGAATQTGFWLVMLGLGIVAGSLFAAKVARKDNLLAMVPVGALILPLALATLAFLPAQSWLFNIALIFVGLGGGFFLVPLNTFLQDRAPEDSRGRILAANNILINLAGLAVVGLQLLMSSAFGWTFQTQLLVSALASLIVGAIVVTLLPETLIRLVLTCVGNLFYRIRTIGGENLPATGPALLVCNHVSYVDVALLQLACPRKIRFISFDQLFHLPILGAVLRLFETIPISDRRAKEGIRAAARALEEGEIVCVFPEGELSRTGGIQGFRRGFELIARQSMAPVIPVHLDGVWGSIFSFERGRYFFKTPLRLPFPVTISFGTAIPFESATAAKLQQAVMALGAEAFAQRPSLREHLGRHLIRALRKKTHRVALTDYSTEKPRAVRRSELLIAGWLLAQRWKKTISGQRIGIALPPGLGGTLANLACILANKVPVNLNITAGPNAAKHALSCGAIDTIITVPEITNRFPTFPWAEDTRDLTSEIKSFSSTDRLLAALTVLTLPPSWLASALDLPHEGDQAEACLLFTSGSSGLPKGVVLSHRNILANTTQVTETNFLQPSDRLLGALPLFHSFGLTICLWLPLLRGVPLVTTPSPLETKAVGRAVREGRVTILTTTPTFLRSYSRKLQPADFTSVRLCLSGAEKLPAELRQSVQANFGFPILEGYGLTETSPVISVNLPNPDIGLGASSPQSGHQPGTVGRIVPGIAVRLLDPETGHDLDLHQSGILAVRGANVMPGYLNDPEKTAQVIQDGWFITGDIVRFNNEGFLIIEGRLSRFSKIGGEMVPHETVENSLLQTLATDPASSDTRVVVVGIPDEAKGEALVALITVEVDPVEIRTRLAANGIPNLWIPKRFLHLDPIPTLASGKLDLAQCRLRALESTTPAPVQ